MSEWKSMDTAPRDGTVIEVEAIVHGIIKVRWTQAFPGYLGTWDKDGDGVMFPVYPDRWREVQSS